MRTLKASTAICLVAILSLLVIGSACQTTPVTNTTTNTNTANTNAAATANTNTAPVSDAGTTIETREPEQYRATLVFTAEAPGKPQKVELPVEVARNGADRRYAFTIPTIGPVIFLDRADTRYIIMPSRRQYAELTPDLVGFDFRSMTPGQMVEQLQKQRGVERVGEEQRDGRTVIKYRYAATTKTGSQAGDVTTESFVYVDKDTGLPIRAEGFGQATGNVQGVNSGRVVAEMRNLQTDVDPSLFEVPQGLNKLTSEQIKQQLSVLATLFQALMSTINAQQQAAASASPSPATTASPMLGASPATSPR